MICLHDKRLCNSWSDLTNTAGVRNMRFYCTGRRAGRGHWYRQKSSGGGCSNRLSWGGVIFLFQAEDGIRDHCVTGVQLCALFFSSRRRHTRSLCDWSSDVCSSDLKQKTAYEITV